MRIDKPTIADFTNSQHDHGDADSGGRLVYAGLPAATAASKLVGRGDSGAGDMQEISLGSGLTMAGTTLKGTSGNLSVLTNGDTAFPELIFALGDVIMVPTP